MKSRPRGNRSTKLPARFEHDKENLWEGRYAERAVAARLGQLPTPHRSTILQRQRRQTDTLTHGHSGETLQPFTRRLKKPSFELPQLGQQSSLRKPSLQRQPRIHRFYTDVEEQPLQQVRLSFKQDQDMRTNLNQLLTSKLRHFSMQQQFAKLNALTRRCAALRRDLVSVQSDLLTINLTVQRLTTQSIIHEPS